MNTANGIDLGEVTTLNMEYRIHFVSSVILAELFDWA